MHIFFRYQLQVEQPVPMLRQQTVNSNSLENSAKDIDGSVVLLKLF